MKKVLGIDIGYGDCKCVMGTSDGEIIKKFKFPSSIGLTSKLEHVKDSKIKKYKDHHYYVGENASHVSSDHLIDIEEYKNLEYYAPLMLQHALEIVGETPDIIVTGLSIAQIQNSGYFQAALNNFVVDDIQYDFPNIIVIPQGAGSKLCIDVYGDNFPVKQTEFLGATTYVGCDIGFSTLDLFLVNNGETKADLFEGIEKEGIMKIATKIAKKVHDEYGRSITLSEAKNIVDTGVYKLRGQKHDLTDFVNDVKNEYLKNVLRLVNERYPGILDNADFISISGGGSTIFKNGSSDKFIRIPKAAHEYYNSIGFFLRGVSKCNQ